MIPVVAALLEGGLSLLGNAVLAKGKEWVEDKTGLKLQEKSYTPEQIQALKQAEMDHEEELLKLQLESDKLSLERERALLDSDDSARKMQIAALQQDDLFSKRFAYYFAMAWSAFAMIFIIIISVVTIPATSVRFVDTILGFLLGTVIAQLISYFYGSSSRSAKKDETISKLSGGK